MPFRFPLESVLHLRRSLEHQQELRLRAANQQVARVRHMIDLLDHRVGEIASDFSQQLTRGVNGAEMHFRLLSEETLKKHRAVLERESARLEGLRDQQQNAYQQARRDRETFESLRDHQLLEYKRVASRHEQQQLDEAFLLQRFRRG